MRKTIELTADEVEQILLAALDVDAPEGCTLVVTLEEHGVTITIANLDPPKG